MPVWSFFLLGPMELLGWGSKTLTLLGLFVYFFTESSSLTLDLRMILICTWSCLLAPHLKANLMSLEKRFFRPQIKNHFLRWWYWAPGGKGACCVLWVSGVENSPFLGLLLRNTCLCLVSHDTCFLPCPCGLASSYWHLVFADFAMWFYFFFVCRLFLREQRK